jgi:hypothetical protein
MPAKGTVLEMDALSLNELNKAVKFGKSVGVAEDTHRSKNSGYFDRNTGEGTQKQ